MIQCINNILEPYYDKQRELLGLASEQPDVALFDVFNAHWDPLFLAELDKRIIIPVFVLLPAQENSSLWTLSVNGEFKHLLKNEFVMVILPFLLWKKSWALFSMGAFFLDSCTIKVYRKHCRGLQRMKDENQAKKEN